jgi:uncharacterized membrane protein YdfJ with MMPL/SSD domain
MNSCEQRATGLVWGQKSGLTAQTVGGLKQLGVGVGVGVSVLTFVGWSQNSELPELME